MPPRDPPLPEGTDQIIDTNLDVGGSAALTGTGGGGAATMGSPGSGPTETGRGITMTTDTTSGAGATGDSSAFQFNEGRASASTTGGSTGGDNGGKSGVGKAADTIVNQLKDQVGTLRSTAGDRARNYAVDGKRQATDLLNNIADVLRDAAGSVENRLGGQYSGVGNRAADQVASFARTLDDREIDDLIQDARAFVTRSPAIAIGVAALVGFAVARVVRSGVEDLTASHGSTSGGTSDQAGTAGTTGTTDPTGTSGGIGIGATGGLGATSGGFGEQGVGTAGTLGESGSTNGTGSSAPSY